MWFYVGILILRFYYNLNLSNVFLFKKFLNIKHFFSNTSIFTIFIHFSNTVSCVVSNTIKFRSTRSHLKTSYFLGLNNDLAVEESVFNFLKYSMPLIITTGIPSLACPIIMDAAEANSSATAILVVSSSLP